MTEQEIQDAIAGLERVVNSGATSVVIDGQTTNFDIPYARKRLRELRNDLRKVQGKTGSKRPVMGSFDLSSGTVTDAPDVCPCTEEEA